MNFASTALRQRQRESKALRIFLACSLAGSLMFHLALLASEIGKYLLNRVLKKSTIPVLLLSTRQNQMVNDYYVSSSNK